MRPRTRWTRAIVATLAFALASCELALTREAPFGTVRVQANSRAGVPLPGIEVRLYTGRRPMGYQVTDAAGRATFRDVPPAEYGVLLGLPDGYADLSELMNVPPDLLRDGIRIDAGRDTTLNFTFARRGLGSIEARTRDSAGVAIRGLRVTFYRSSGEVGAAITDSAGIARLDSVLTGIYGAFVIPPDSLGVKGQPFTFRDGLLVDGDFVPRAEFTLATCRGSIAVEVRDQFDAPIAGIEALRYAVDGSSQRDTTDAAGTITFLGVPCGEHGVALQPLAGFTVNFVRDSGFVDGLRMTRGAVLSATLRATRN